MKKLRKLSALLLALTLLLSLSACGSFETKMAKAANKMEKLNSYHMSMSMPLSMTISILDQDVGMDMDIGWELDVRKEPMAAAGTMTVSVLGVSQEVPFYMEKVGEEYKMYTDTGYGWTAETVPAGEQSFQLNALESLQLLLRVGKSFAESGTEIVSGSEATRFDGVIEGELVSRALELSGAVSALTETLGMGRGLKPKNLAEFNGIPTSIWIDNKSGMIVRYDMDMAEIVHSLSTSLMDGMKEEYGLEDEDMNMDLSINSLKASAVLSQFDQISEIIIPDEARAAA